MHRSFKIFSTFLTSLITFHFQFMLRGLPHLAKYVPEPKDARRLIPDPENEPNFYAISKRYPLPDDPDFGKNEPVEAKLSGEVPKPAASPGRLASQVDWMQSQLPAAKRQAMMPTSADTILGLAAAQQSAAALGLPPSSTGPGLAELQQLINSNNQLLAVAALRSSLNFPTTSNPSAAAIAAFLQAAKNGGVSQPRFGPPSG